jgi:hypothetical protein
VNSQVSGHNRVTYTFEVVNVGQAQAYLGNVDYQAWLGRQPNLSGRLLAAGGAMLGPHRLFLGPGERATFTFTGSTPAFRAHEYPYLIIQVDAGNALPESNERNNWRAAVLR